MQKLISILIVIVTVLPSAMGENFNFWKVQKEYVTDIRTLPKTDPTKHNRVIPVVVFPDETSETAKVELSLSIVNVNFDGDENAVATWNLGDLKSTDDQSVVITVEDGTRVGEWMRKIQITEENKGFKRITSQYSNGRTTNPKIIADLEVYVKVNEDATTWTFGQGISDEPRSEVAENIKAQLEKRYGEGKVSQKPGNKFTVPASPSPTPTPPEDGLSGGVIAGIVVGCLAFLAGIGAAIRAVLTGNCGWFSQKYSDYVQASPGDEESFCGCFAKNSDSGSEVRMANLMKTDK